MDGRDGGQPFSGLTAMYGRVIATVTANALAQIALVEDEFAVPLGFEPADRWEQLENYLDDLRGQDEVWTALIDHWSQTRGLLWAHHEAVREATRLERSLAKAGNWDGTEEDLPRAQDHGAFAVRLRQWQRRLGVAEKAVEAAHRIEAEPKFWVTREIAPYDPLMTAIGQDDPTLVTDQGQQVYG